MDPYEATKIVFSRIQKLDPENASKVMGLLLMQDHGEKEMIRLAFGPESLLQSVVLKARQELGISPSTPPTPSSPSPFFSTATTAVSTAGSNQHHHYNPLSLSRQNSASSSPPNNPSRLFLPNGLKIPSLSVSSPSSLSSPSWGPNSLPDFQNPDELISPSSSSANYFPTTDVIDEIQLQEQLSFLNGPQQDLSSLSSPGPGGGATWGPPHRRSCSVNDISFGDEPAGWKPCLYYARGYCKNGSSCRFVHGGDSGSSSPTLVGSPSKVEMMGQCHELLRSNSMQHHKLMATSHLMSAGANSFPYSGSKFFNLLLQQQQQQNESPRATAAALMMGEDMNKLSRSRLSRSDFLVNGDSNPGSRQIYLTFPADSTFREEDVSNYFSIFGPVQDVRIPYQQKRMFGFVTFLYPETVRLILAKGNPHFVCDARVLVKPYKEKGKIPDKYRKQQQQLQMERGEFSACSSPTALDPRDPFDNQQGSRMMYSNTQELLWRRKLEEQADLQQALELQSRRLMSLQLDMKRSHHHRALSTGAAPFPSSTYTSSYNQPATVLDHPSPDGTQAENGSSPASKGIPATDAATNSQTSQQTVNDNDSGNHVACEENHNGMEGSLNNEPERLEHNLPDSPFASPTKGNVERATAFTNNEHIGAGPAISSANGSMLASSLIPASSTLEHSPFKSCYFQMPRFSTGSGAIGM